LKLFGSTILLSLFKIVLQIPCLRMDATN